MLFPEEYAYLLYTVVIGHAVISIIIIVVSTLLRNERTKFFPVLFGVNLAFFVASIILGSNNLNFDQLMDSIAYVGYAAIISYVIAIEIPGYVILSRFDDKLSEMLQKIRMKMISLNYDFGNLKGLIELHDSARMRLTRTSVAAPLTEFIKRSKAIGNIDKTLYELALSELTEHINSISTRSKHPFPKLIEIASLAGISFLIGQFLNYFLP